MRNILKPLGGKKHDKQGQMNEQFSDILEAIKQKVSKGE
jgi:hypothetical protein